MGQGKGGGKQPKGGKGGDKGKGSKQSGKVEKQGNTKTSSMVSSGLSVCLLIVYGLIAAFAAKTVADNPMLMAKLSDSRVKKNVKHVDYGMKELLQLTPKSYNYINEEDLTTRHIGLMAQDLKEVMPELVIELETNKVHDFKNHVSSDIESLYAVKYHELVPVLINSIKELKQEVDTLKQRL